jgi:hypothetical protein
MQPAAAISSSAASIDQRATQPVATHDARIPFRILDATTE